MAGSRQFNERCVCGAEITISENYSFTPLPETKQEFERWQRTHRHCLVLFRQIQQAKMKLLED
jgi:hypothetical protein